MPVCKVRRGGVSKGLKETLKSFIYLEKPKNGYFDH